MLRSKVSLAIAAVLVVAVAAPSSWATKNTEVIAKLKGKNEVPGPGSPKGSSDFFVLVKPNKNKLCFTFSVKKLDPITEGHIHKGTADEAGPVKVPLFQDQQGLEGTGSYDGCVEKVKSSLLDKIANTPEKFYVNLHTLDYPDGAIRGQLGFPPSP